MSAMPDYPPPGRRRKYQNVLAAWAPRSTARPWWSGRPRWRRCRWARRRSRCWRSRRSGACTFPGNVGAPGDLHDPEGVSAAYL